MTDLGFNFGKNTKAIEEPRGRTECSVVWVIKNVHGKGGWKLKGCVWFTISIS